MNHLALILIACAPLTVSASTAENFVCSRFTLSLRQEDSPNSGRGFISRNDRDSGVCIYGRYRIDKSKKPAIFTFTPNEVWRANRLDTFVWSHSTVHTQVLTELSLRFEWERIHDGLVLTHIPTSDSIAVTDAFMQSVNWGKGEIIQFKSTTSDAFVAKELPPYLCSLSTFANRPKLDPKKPSWQRTLTDNEWMFTDSEGAGGRAGFGALKLTPTSEKNTSSGSAWMFHHDVKKGVMLAGRGTYALDVNSVDSQSVVMELKFPRIFERQSGKGVSSWKVMSPYESGMMLKIPLTDRGLPLQPNAYATEFFFVNADGSRERQFYREGFLNLKRSEVEIGSCLELDLLSSIQFQPLANLKKFDLAEVRYLYESLVTSPPPSFSQKSLDSGHLSKPPPDPRLALKGKPTSEYRKFLEKHPNDYNVLVEYINLLPKEDNENLRWGFQQLVRLKPGNASLHLKHSQYAEAAGKRYEATEALKQASKLSKGDEQAATHKRLSKVLFDQKKYKEAYDTLEKYVVFEPKDIEAHAQLASWYGQHGTEKWSSETALKFAPIAQKNRDKSLYGEYNQIAAGVYAKLGRWNDAIDIENRLILERIDVRKAKYYRELFLERQDLSQCSVYQYWDAINAELGVLGKVVDYQRETLKLQRPNGTYTTMVISKLTEESRRQLPREFSIGRVSPRQ